ncbi:GNAT family N-acetyltransferase [Sphingomonas sp. HITSZ_GF]|uniref:GNAT family N-acetyltransferase n=1 Tax=Sphingomonas sp. HITSZ_GF TaxID=3037247 RepID=UPI00240D0DBE|nr:GNAT family N-acetyltransferase [Sphingomonas sp. HITSZ_GF]MDG2532422.1 GNAT family N-acetyltransferase [Sphingomonas sp. HITSZ_GF]
MADLDWADDPATAEAVARFFARTIGDDPRYISHGEIQCGLSDDGLHWHPELEARFREDMRDIGEETGLLVARAADGEIAGAAIVEWTVTRRVRFATLADLSVAPGQRSTGLGAHMLAAIECEARRRGMAWIFLESGKDNLRAHGFFERHGFKELSHVFARRL